ncbi:MAG TPA: hypothetical protein DCM62_03490 [Bacteroidales bacterium]|nr:hypothetical protein [Bacteroidales bacterium]
MNQNFTTSDLAITLKKKMITVKRAKFRRRPAISVFSVYRNNFPPLLPSPNVIANILQHALTHSKVQDPARWDTLIFSN